MKPVTLGLIVGNRGFFPAELCLDGRKMMLEVLKRAGFRVVTLATTDTKFGSVETVEDARKCAALFATHRQKIDGVLVTLPNFGDERAVANALRWAGLKVPVLVHAFPDLPGNMQMGQRRDSFCGKMSVCNNLRQYGIPFTLPRLHTAAPGSESFRQDLADFAVTCRVVRGLRNLRIGALGARPAAFNTVRYSEKLLEQSGISVETLDLFELFGWVGQLKDNDRAVTAKLKQIKAYANTATIPAPALLKMAKFGAAVDRWTREQQLQVTAIQCWTAMESFFGVVPCTLMSMLSNGLFSSACEVDVVGAVAMHALAAGSGKPSALVDWNNNYGDDPDKAVIFHCSNLPKDLLDGARMDTHEILKGIVGEANTYGTINGRLRATPFTFLRVSTDDIAGKIRAYIGAGELTNDPLQTFGGYGVCCIPNFQQLLAHICQQGFEHHVVINPTSIAAPVQEALAKYLTWDVHRH